MVVDVSSLTADYTPSESLRHQIAPCPEKTQSTVALVVEHARECGRAHLTDVSQGEPYTHDSYGNPYPVFDDFPIQ